MKEETTLAINLAEKYLEEHDPILAAYVLRDLEDVAYLGLCSMVWAMTSSCSTRKNDVLFLIELLGGSPMTAEIVHEGEAGATVMPPTDGEVSRREVERPEGSLPQSPSHQTKKEEPCNK